MAPIRRRPPADLGVSLGDVTGQADLVPGDGFDPEVIMAAYGAVAGDDAATFGDDLAEFPLDRSMLDVVAARGRDRGLVLDLGCGPGRP